MAAKHDFLRDAYADISSWASSTLFATKSSTALVSALGASSALLASYALYTLTRPSVLRRRRALDPARTPCKWQPHEFGRLVAGVELGGTTCKVAIASSSDPEKLIDVLQVDTETPEKTLGKIADWLAKKPFAAIGIAAFGPIDLDHSSPTYGHFTTTPKLPFQNTNLLSYFTPFAVPISLDTDVNAPALSEILHGGHVFPGEMQASSCAYVTVGTGVGVGVFVNGGMVHGLMHPEGGHVQVARKKGDGYKGFCKAHCGEVACIEGMVCSGAIVERTGKKSVAELPAIEDSHEVWDTVAFYLAQLCMSLTLIASPHVIVFGGGVMNRKCLIPLVRKHFTQIMNGYIQVDRIKNHLDQYIVLSTLQNPGLVGAVDLACSALGRK